MCAYALPSLLATTNQSDAAASMAPIVLNLVLLVMVICTGYFHSMKDFQPVIDNQHFALAQRMSNSPQYANFLPKYLPR